MGSSNARKQDASRSEKCSKECKKESRKFILRQNFALRSQVALIVACFYGKIKTDEAGTLDFSGVPAFLVTNAFIVQRSAAKMFNIVSGPQLLSIHQGFCDYRPGFQCPWTHGP